MPGTVTGIVAEIRSEELELVEVPSAHSLTTSKQLEYIQSPCLNRPTPLIWRKAFP
jgi:hypothetical protein